VLWHGPQPDWSAISEVQRKHAVQRWQLLDSGALAHRISAAYAQSDSSAAMVVSEVESDADLSRMMQELPAVEDLLETADDAPIIRMLNALLTQAARDGASTSTSSPTSAIPACAFAWTARCARWCSPTAPCTPR
jgi:general secretion pathway protein E